MHASGIATVMFTDLEASTDTTTRLGDEAAAALFAGHDRIVREQLAAHGGRNVRSTGDGFLVLFDSARSARRAARWPSSASSPQHEDGVRVRIGLNAGEVQEGEDGALFGAAINLAAASWTAPTAARSCSPTPSASSPAPCPTRASATAAASRSRASPNASTSTTSSPPKAPSPPAPRRATAGAARAGRCIAAAALAVVASPPRRVLVATRGAEAVDVLPNSVAIIDPAEGRVVAQVPVGVRPAELAVAARLGVGGQPRRRHGDADRRPLAARHGHRLARASTSTGSAPAPAASGWPTPSAGWRA